MVIAHHSCLAYTTFASFDKQDIFRSTAPVVDASRWVFFDYAENFNGVFFRSLMFFISGLFVYQALRRHGTASSSRRAVSLLWVVAWLGAEIGREGR
jgi:glucans biosynthesis protein C